jgi:hypothetical protein
MKKTRLLYAPRMITRAALGTGLMLLATSQASFAESRPVVVDTARSPHAKLHGPSLTEVQWTRGFWSQWDQRLRQTTLPLLYELAAERGAIQNLEIAAGLKQGPYTGNNWMDAWVYKWIEAAACVYADTEDPVLLRQMDELIAIIARAQQPDGYLATQNIVRNRPRFEQPNHHEVYVMGHLLTAAAVHHRMTGKDNLLNVARKTGDFLAARFEARNPEMAHFPFNPSVIMGAVELYRATGEPRYLELANTVIDMRGAFPGGSDQTQDRIPLREEHEVVGHAVFYTYLYAGATDAYLETGDPKLLAALNRLWDDLTRHKLYLTGGTCAQYRGFSIRNGSIYTADDVHEAVGAAYQLPNSPAYNETCGQVGCFLWNWRMLAINGEARFAEMMEREMYNGWLPGIGVEGDSFTYTNPLRWFGEEQELWAQDSLLRHLPADPKRGREAGGGQHGTCCPSNVLRALAELQAAFYGVAGNELWVHQYGGNRFDNGAFRLEQETDYPWDGKVKITMQAAPANASLHLRIPDWADGYRVKVNDTEQPSSQPPGDYLRLQRPWRAGDVIELDLPMRVRLIQAHRKVDSTRGQVAVMRGPLVYCLESVDLPQGVDVSEIILPRNAEWLPKWEPDLLGGLTTLNGRALRLPRDDSALYTQLDDRVPTPIRIRLIPYYAWKNRGVSVMSVWIPATW